MPTTNDKSDSDAFRQGWERIFGKKSSCPLEGTPHFDACSLTKNSDACPFKNTCADMLEDERRNNV